MKFKGEILIDKKEGVFVFIEDINLKQKVYPLSKKTKMHVEDGNQVIVNLIPNGYWKNTQEPDYIAKII